MKNIFSRCLLLGFATALLATTACKDDFFVEPNSNNAKGSSLFVAPQCDSVQNISLGDSVDGFLYAKRSSIVYKVKNGYKFFKVTITDYKKTKSFKYANIYLRKSNTDNNNLLMFHYYNNSYIVESNKEVTDVFVHANNDSASSGYFSCKFTELVVDEIVANKATKQYTTDTIEINDYAKFFKITGTANKLYKVTAKSLTNPSETLQFTITNAKGETVSYNNYFKFPSDGKSCYLKVTSVKGAVISVGVSDLDMGQNAALDLYPSQTFTDVVAKQYADGTPSQWYKFHGTPGVQYLVQRPAYSYFDLSFYDSTLTSFRADTQNFVMPKASFVYIRLSLNSSYQYESPKTKLYVYPETSLKANAIPLTLNQTIKVDFVDTDFLIQDLESKYGWGNLRHVKWYKFPVKAEYSYSFTNEGSSGTVAFGYDYEFGLSSVFYNTTQKRKCYNTGYAYVMVSSKTKSSVSFSVTDH